MKRAVLMIAVLMATSLAASWAQSDPYAPAGDPPSAQVADPQPAPANPSAPADPYAPAPAAATDPDAVNDPDAEGNALPATASHGPLILLMGLLAIGMFLVLKVFRRRSVDVS